MFLNHSSSHFRLKRDAHKRKEKADLKVLLVVLIFRFIFDEKTPVASKGKEKTKDERGKENEKTEVQKAIEVPRQTIVAIVLM
jgi:hypothetical protein